MKKIESLSIEDFVNVTNTFVKSALRSVIYIAIIYFRDIFHLQLQYSSQLLPNNENNELFSYRFCFTCSKTLNVLSVLVKTIYTSCSSELLLPPADLYQFILNHSKFLEIFLGNSNTSGAHGNTKGN